MKLHVAHIHVGKQLADLSAAFAIAGIAGFRADLHRLAEALLRVGVGDAEAVVDIQDHDPAVLRKML